MLFGEKGKVANKSFIKEFRGWYNHAGQLVYIALRNL